jgi:phosphatidylserine synthase
LFHPGLFHPGCFIRVVLSGLFHPGLFHPGLFHPGCFIRVVLSGATHNCCSDQDQITPMHRLLGLIRKNLANATSILGVLPLCVLFDVTGHQYLIPLMIYSNVMDDLDGILAAKLNIRSSFGARLDNVCDALSHSVFVMFVGVQIGGVCIAGAVVAIVAIIVRSVSRLDPNVSAGTGSPTNELIRHVFFIYLLGEQFDFDVSPYLVAAFALNTITMVLPRKLPYMIRSITKSATAIALVNVALIVAWLVPITLPVIAACFVGSYLYSLSSALITRAEPKVSVEQQ